MGDGGEIRAEEAELARREVLVAAGDARPVDLAERLVVPAGGAAVGDGREQRRHGLLALGQERRQRRLPLRPVDLAQKIGHGVVTKAAVLSVSARALHRLDAVHDQQHALLLEDVRQAMGALADAVEGLRVLAKKRQRLREEPIGRASAFLVGALAVEREGERRLRSAPADFRHFVEESVGECSLASAARRDQGKYLGLAV